MINDVSEAIRLNKKPTKTKLDSIKKLISTVNVDDAKKEELNMFVTQDDLTTSQLETLETKLNNKLEN